MRYLSSTLIVIAATITIFAHGANAKTIDSGELIKASTPAVYYYFDGKRYVFPNEDVYYSWYENFDNVNVVSDATLASVPIGGNVTYHPATRLVKIVSDPKVYMVTEKNLLQWIQSEQDAIAIYGAEWAKEVRDVSDALFMDYKITDPLSYTEENNDTWKSAVRLIYPYYATVLKEFIADKDTGDIANFVHPDGAQVIEAIKYGYSASSTSSMDDLYNFFKINSTDWTIQMDYFHGHSSGTARLLNFSKTVGDTFAHRSVIITDEDKPDSTREILFREITFPKGYLSYPGAVTFNYMKGDFDVEQAFITNVSKDELENWYETVGATAGWSSMELVESPISMFNYYRMENGNLNNSIQQVYLDGASIPEFVGLLVVGSELNKTIE